MKYGAVLLMPRSPGTSNFSQSSRGAGPPTNPVTSARPGSDDVRRTIVPAGRTPVGAGCRNRQRDLRRSGHCERAAASTPRTRSAPARVDGTWTLAEDVVKSNHRRGRVVGRRLWGRLSGPAVALAAGAFEYRLSLLFERVEPAIGIRQGASPSRTASDKARTRSFVNNTRWNDDRSSSSCCGGA